MKVAQEQTFLISNSVVKAISSTIMASETKAGDKRKAPSPDVRSPGCPGPVAMRGEAGGSESPSPDVRSSNCPSPVAMRGEAWGSESLVIEELASENLPPVHDGDECWGILCDIFGDLYAMVEDERDEDTGEFTVPHSSVPDDHQYFAHLCRRNVVTLSRAYDSRIHYYPGNPMSRNDSPETPVPTKNGIIDSDASPRSIIMTATRSKNYFLHLFSHALWFLRRFKAGYNYESKRDGSDTDLEYIADFYDESIVRFEVAITSLRLPLLLKSIEEFHDVGRFQET